ncbi:MAG: hypothetical protein R2843_11580 [Thermomicrobiales bacterium]
MATSFGMLDVEKGNVSLPGLSSGWESKDDRLKPGDPGFLLNRDDGWLDFALHHLEIVDGRLMLESRPGSAGRCA